jgi:Protein of unknown function (DUF2505)
MPRQIDYRSTSPHSAAEVYATMVDPDFLRARLDRIGGPGAGLLEHTADADGARYRLRHGVDAKELPTIVRAVLPGNLTIERTERWTRQDRAYLADIHVAIPGAPGAADGEMRLRDLPDGGSELTVQVDVTVSVPLVGGKIEGVVTEYVRDIIASETEFTQQWLAGRP